MAVLLDAPQSQLDKTVRVFDAFYNLDLVVDANQFELIYSYFYDISKNKNTAINFTSIILRISNITGENALSLLDQLKSTTNFKSNALLTYYLNSFKSKTTLYGISLVGSPNQLAQRNILQ